MPSGAASPARVSPCHALELFVKHDGLVYPCCRVGGGDGQVDDHAAKIIGHVSDPGLMDAIRAYAGPCRCPGRRLRPLSPDEPLRGGRLNIELSLACQGRCAFCCVFAPEFAGGYGLFDQLERLIKAYSPGDILVQGGEVLVQPQSLAWIGAMRERYPGIPWILITNGCADETMLATVERLFEAVHFSIGGFAPQTYKAVMGLDFERTKRFAEGLCRGGRTRVQLKFMATPSNIHEIPLFLRWAMELSPASVAVETISIGQYVNMNTFDSYWSKIFERTGRETKRVLDSRDQAAPGPEVLLSDEARRLLDLDTPRGQGSAPPDVDGASAEDHADYLCDEAWEHIGAKRFGKARELLAVAAAHGDFPRIGHARVILELLEVRLDEALHEAGSWLVRFPDDPDLILARASVLARMGRHDEAEAAVGELLLRRPLHWAAHLSLSDVHRYAGRLEKSLEHLDRALAIHPHLQRGVKEKRRSILEKLQQSGATGR